VSDSFHMFLWSCDGYYGTIDTLLSGACGTYIINLNVIIIISEHKVIIYILSLFS
jgi:hypothetical protein